MQRRDPGRDVDLTSVVLALFGSAVGRDTGGATAGGRMLGRWIMPALLIWGLATLLAAWNPLEIRPGPIRLSCDRNDRPVLVVLSAAALWKT